MRQNHFELKERKKENYKDSDCGLGDAPVDLKGAPEEDTPK